MLLAARKAGTINMVNFNYRRVPAVAASRSSLIESGRIGEIRHWRAVYLQDWLVERVSAAGVAPEEGACRFRRSGRHRRAHPRSLPVPRRSSREGRWHARHVRQAASDRSGEHRRLRAVAGKLDSELGDVTVDDASTFLARFENGAIGTFEATRMAPGRRNFNSFEISGSLGSIAFNLERLNELQVYFREDEAGFQGFRTINVTEGVHPYTGAWWPAGHIIGWEHTHVHVVRRPPRRHPDGRQPGTDRSRTATATRPCWTRSSAARNPARGRRRSRFRPVALSPAGHPARSIQDHSAVRVSLELSARAVSRRARMAVATRSRSGRQPGVERIVWIRHRRRDDRDVVVAGNCCLNAADMRHPNELLLEPATKSLRPSRGSCSRPSARTAGSSCASRP